MVFKSYPKSSFSLEQRLLFSSIFRLPVLSLKHITSNQETFRLLVPTQIVSKQHYSYFSNFW